MLSSRLRRMVRSLEAKSLLSAGTTRTAKSSAPSVSPICVRTRSQISPERLHSVPAAAESLCAPRHKLSSNCIARTAWEGG